MNENADASEACFELALEGFDAALTVFTKTDHNGEWEWIQAHKVRIDMYRHPRKYPEPESCVYSTTFDSNNPQAPLAIAHTKHNIALFLRMAQ